VTFTTREVSMRTHRIGALVAAAALAVICATGAAAQTADVAGDWDLAVDVMGNVTTPSMTITQNGEAITGHYTSATLGEADFEGTVSGSQLTFSIETEAQGQALTVTYVLTLNADGTLTGTIDLSGLASGTVRGTRG
jgi:hypothetical protein